MKIEFKFYQDKKHSRRYQAVDPEAPIRDIYVLRPFSDGKQTITITVEVKEE